MYMYYNDTEYDVIHGGWSKYYDIYYAEYILSTCSMYIYYHTEYVYVYPKYVYILSYRVCMYILSTRYIYILSYRV